jgi:DNA-3-methyladenine glycosylase I
MTKYHDEEWGTPLHDDNKLFEFLVLEGAQAGLSWNTILNRREGYRQAFENYDIKKIAKYTKKDFERLVSDAGIIRNRLKIKSAINNARKFLEVQKEFGSFDRYIWAFTAFEPVNNKIKSDSQIPPSTPLSDEISEDLKNRGFSFVGTTIIYAHLQATGMVNDHLVSCFRYRKI